MTSTLTIPPVPRLEIDRLRHSSAAGGLRAGQLVERQLAWALLHTMSNQFPNEKLGIDSGDEVSHPADLEQAMEEIFNLDECWLCWGRAQVLIICGNDEDFISDYTLRPGVEEAVQLAERWVGTRA